MKDLLIINANLIDGTGNPPQKQTAILIRDGKIADISYMESAEGTEVINAKGATVMPGLIDAHVHLQSVPGSVYRGDPDDKLERLRKHHLRAYLACGVTSVLDNGISAAMLKQFHEYLDAGGVGPRIYAVAPAFYPPDGYLDHGLLTPQWGPHWGPAGSREDVKKLFEKYEGLRNIVGVKVLLEPGFGATRIWPVHSPEMQKVIRDESAKRNLPIYVHAYGEKEQQVGLNMGVHNLAHAGFLKSAPSDAFIERMLELGTYVTTTLASTLDQHLVQFDLARLDEPLNALAVPEEELQTARDLKAWEQTNYTLIRTSAPKWIPDFLVRFIAKKVNMEKQVKACVENSSKAIYEMYKAGIPVSLGTDTANWPIFLNFYHGPSTIREVELLGLAGLPPMDVLQSATRIPAEMMGKSDEIGTVEVGKFADMIMMPSDPLEDLNALKNISLTIKNGVARTPEQWLTT